MNKRRIFLVLVALMIGVIYFFTAKRNEDGSLAAGGDEEVRLSSIRKSETIPSNEIVSAMEKLNVPIEFWGRVIDQDGVGVEGASVSVSVRKGVSRFSIEEVESLKALSDSRGRFSFSGLRGFQLILDSIEKEGYRLASRQKHSVNYDSGEVVANSSDKPYPFVLIGTENRPSIIYNKYSLFTQWEGDPVHIDLRNGVVNGPWDIKIVAVRQPGNSSRYDWEFLVASDAGGGIANALPGNPPTVAPADGYQSEWSIGYLHDDVDYRGGGDWDFFVRMKNGNYARVQLTAYLSEQRRNSNLVLRVYINESGGRVLENLDSY